MLKQKDVLGLYDVSASDIMTILEKAASMKKMLSEGPQKLSHLQGKTIATLFYEKSTRTRVSFELATKYLGGSTLTMNIAYSSVQKGETLIDTGRTLEVMKIDALVIRHPMAGAPALLANNVKATIINAGDGMNEHPTQALLDMLTIREKFPNFKNLKVAILGDIKHSRVAKSNLFGLTKLGAKVYMYAPHTLIPKGIETLGATITKTREEALEGADVVMGLRIQLERQQGGAFPSLSEYHQFYGINKLVLKYAKKNALIMHPGPVNRGVEMTSEVIDHHNSKINEQVLNGIAVRMALLSLLIQPQT
ncbi:MAG: aspartate carbamoyltransferase catalytic subunit [Chitinophagaceae bacterium]